VIDWFAYGIMTFSALASLEALVASIAKRKPSLITVTPVAAIELLLLVQLVASIFLVAQGQTSSGDIFEYFGYLFVALLVPLGAVLWALAEPTHTSTLVLAVGSFTVAVMAARMGQIWGIF
jgi:hypothetical protein